MRTRTMLLCGLLFGAGAGSVAADEATQGYLYGTVETTGGKKYTGVLRWGNEEAFWDDLYNASKLELPSTPEEVKKKGSGKRLEVFGVPIWVTSPEGSRQFIARFGDLEELRRLGDEIEAVMKGGKVLRIGDGSNDQGAAIRVLDATLGEVKIPWEKVVRVRFAATPGGVGALPARLYGRVKTSSGELEGFIQWDSEECLATDKLDGDSDDGRMSIEMGKLRAIEKRNRDGSFVELKDGRRLVLEGTNDVDSSIRGVLVETANAGRVEVAWEAFERVELLDGKGSGRAYGDYPPARPLRAKVTTRSGESKSGELTYDLDESLSSELLNGARDGVEYSIPFSIVRSLVRQNDGRCAVTLASGVTLVLGEQTDVDEDNAGLSLRIGAAQTYIPWEEVARIDLEH